MDYSLNRCLQEFKISQTLLEYLEIEILEKNGKKFITEESFNKAYKFKQENPNTRVLLQKYTFKKKYGVDNPQQLKEIQNKTKNTIFEKYGCENPSQSDEIKQKKIETLQSHYGDDIINPMHVKEIINKVKNNWENKSQEEIDSYTAKNKLTSLKNFG